MVKKRRVKNIYQVYQSCPLCNSPYKFTGNVFASYPQQYQYHCSNEKCLNHQKPTTFYKLYPCLEYEFEDEWIEEED